MSKEEYEEQQFYYRYTSMDPQEMQEKFRNKVAKDSIEEEEKKEKLDALQIKLITLIKEKFKTCLTKRQKEVIELYLMQKKQEYMGQILGCTQEAVWSRLTLSFKRLKEACDKDEEIQKLLKEMRQI